MFKPHASIIASQNYYWASSVSSVFKSHAHVGGDFFHSLWWWYFLHRLIACFDCCCVNQIRKSWGKSKKFETLLNSSNDWKYSRTIFWVPADIFQCFILAFYLLFTNYCLCRWIWLSIIAAVMAIFLSLFQSASMARKLATVSEVYL